MSIKISISIDAAAPKAKLEKIAKVAKDRAKANAAVAEAVAEMARGHIKSRYVDEERGTNFWTRVQGSIESEGNEKGGVVSFNELGVGIRYRGGEVRPGKSISSYTGKPTRALAIPTDQVPIVNHRRLPPHQVVKGGTLLAFMRAASRGDTVGVLVEGQQKVITRGPNKGKTRIVPKPGGNLLFVLRKIARHRPDPGIVPSEEAIRAAGQYAIQRLIFG